MVYKEEEQSTLFDMHQFEEWRHHWVGMPEFTQNSLEPWKSISVHFTCPSDLYAFADAIGQKLTRKTKSVWYPDVENFRYSNKRYTDES